MADTILYGPDGSPIRRQELTREAAAPTLTGIRILTISFLPLAVLSAGKVASNGRWSFCHLGGFFFFGMASRIFQSDRASAAS